MESSQTSQDKKDYRAELLKTIHDRYGLKGAMVMESAFKNEDKQLKDAMLGKGMTSSDVAQTQGINLAELPKFQGAKNLFSSASVTPEGNIQESGFFAGPFGTSTADVLERLGALSQIQRRTQMAQATPMDAITFDPNSGKYLDQNGQEVTELKKGQQVRTAALSPEMMGNRESAKQTEQQKYFKEPEIQGLNDLKDTRDTLAEVRSGLEEMGIKDPSKYGGIISETINSELGPISLPARFNLYGQYAKDPKYNAMKTKMERAFQKFRKVVTGAQASNQELQSLRPLIASFKDRPGVFFENLTSLEDETGRMLSNRLDTYDDVGRDTSRLRKRLGSITNEKSLPKSNSQPTSIGKFKIVSVSNA